MNTSPRRFDGKIIAIAGGGGIGNEVARRLASLGATVFLGDYDGPAAETAATRLRGEGLDVTGQHLDGADQASVAAFFGAIEAAHGGIDGAFVNFASFLDAGSPANVLGLPIADYDEVMRINARGYVLCTQAAIPLLLKRGGGSLIYTSSGSAHDAAPIRTAYAMSKAAGHALMRHVATAFGPQGIRTNSIAPGYIIHEGLGDYAPILEQQAIEESPYKPRTGVPTDMAGLVEYLMSSEGEIITGQVISIDGGITMRP